MRSRLTLDGRVGVVDAAVAAVRATVAKLRRLAARVRRRRRARVFRTELRHLDDRMLHDLGIDRSEIDSVAGEMSGLTEATRLRALLSTQLVP